MPSAEAMALAGVTAIYLFLRFMLYLTQDAREPPAILTSVPFFEPIVGMFREKSHFHLRLRDTYRLPIYTLRLPFSRMYVVNATELIPALQKQWRTVSFAALAADAGHVVGLSKEGNEILHRDLTSEHGFSPSWPKYIMSAMGPGKDLDSINRASVEVFAEDMDKLRANGTTKTGLWEWAREIMVKSTTEAVWGPENPYRDTAVAEAWKTFEAGFLTLSVFPLASLFFPKLYRARELAAAAMIGYVRKGGYKTASGLVRKRYEHHVEQFGLGLDDFARGELGNTFAVLGNSTPCALWVLFHIFSDDRVLTDIRSEVSAMVKEQDGVNCIDLATIRTSCPILLSTFQETLRFRAVNSGPRVVLEEVLLNDRILLKKGSMLMIPAPVQHMDTEAWGSDANQFDHTRFVHKPGQKKPNRTAFRAFGGGHVLCPGRHFASTEIMALAALLVLQFDVVPVGGEWIEPTWKNSPIQAGFPIPDEDIDVELRPRDSGKKWLVTFTGSDEAMGIVSEDIEPLSGT
ncbi:cytochrome p450 oxidoreductase [Diaporthe amygdali]|uniref:cytochrome p450 oxidoreductase n=1 Tax=Phomopsis amygdali TaxID=1214568 RepID=UPI0022FE1D70|nr:cytochrome p450 oxidoreductase [Diaporthe amygdali]KAJ0109492.1 cytochrome p450 oxidoreductase [Diaporthe amygdali]